MQQEVGSLLTGQSATSTGVASSDDHAGQENISSAFNIVELLSELALLYHQAVSMSDSINQRDTSRIFTSIHLLDGSTLGQSIEFTTNTPVMCSLDAYLVTFLVLKQSQAKRHTGSQAHRTCPIWCRCAVSRSPC